MYTPEAITLAIVFGIVPPIIWLVFWLKEDSIHPEPNKYIVLTFILGMLAVPLAIPLEHLATIIFAETALIFISWAVIEEVLKFIAAYVGGVHCKEMDEPIDAIIYLITPALGFAALENVFFLLEPFANGSALLGLVTSNVRFVGSTLLHVVSSSIIGLAIALSFYRKQRIQIVYVIVGLVLAIVLHALFNFLIIKASDQYIFIVFLFVWMAVISLLLLFEKVKRIKQPK